MFKKMAEEKDFCQEILRIFLEDDKLEVLESEVQWSGTNLQGRSVILDSVCVLGDKTLVNIEVQKTNNDDPQRRVRYNGAVLTTNTTETGTKFEEVPNVIVIFISTFDIFKTDKALNHIERIVKESGKVVDNGFREIYVNSKAKDGTTVSELMKVFTEDFTYNEEFPVTSAVKKRYKETAGGDSGMCEITQEIYNRGIADGREEGREEGRQEGRQEGLAALHKLIKQGIITTAQAASTLNMDEDVFNQQMKEFAL